MSLRKTFNPPFLHSTQMTPGNMTNHGKKILFRFLVLLCSFLTICFMLTLHSAIIRREALPKDGTTCTTSSITKKANLDCPCVEGIDCHDLPSVKVNATWENKTSLNQTSSAFESWSRLIIPTNESDMRVSILSNLWNFKDIGDQLLYVYEKLITKDWNSNRTNTDILRQELAKYRTELNDSSTIILHHNNVKENESVKSVHGEKLIKISPKIYNLLPKSDPLPHGKKFPSCAVVGNSGSLLNSSCGKQVDKHDFVFRCNVAPLPPFERDAGMKSNFNTMNPSIVRKRYRNLKTKKTIKQFNDELSHFDGVIAIPCFDKAISDAMKAISTYKGKTPKMVCMNSKHFLSVVHFWRDRDVTDKNLSSGFYIVTMAIQLCDEIELYGFWPFDSRFGNSRMNVPYHYFDNASAEKADKAHSMDKEFSILVQLHNLGIVHLNLGPCK